MPISFFKSTANNNGYLVRPNGYVYPAGLNNSGDSNDGPISVDYLVVAGGAGASGGSAGGGGAGGLLTASGYTITKGTSYTVTVGAGSPGTAAPAGGGTGSNSSFGPSITAYGGGGSWSGGNGENGEIGRAHV